jgi:hypothetical protein
MESVSFWRQPKFNLVPDARLAISYATGEPSFEAGVYNQGETVMECAWCGSYGAHKPDCKALSRNYPRTSLRTQRDMTAMLRAEMDQKVERTYYKGAAAAVTVKPEPPKDVRTDLQKRFDAIAEELDESK